MINKQINSVCSSLLHAKLHWPIVLVNSNPNPIPCPFLALGKVQSDIDPYFNSPGVTREGREPPTPSYCVWLWQMETTAAMHGCGPLPQIPVPMTINPLAYITDCSLTIHNSGTWTVHVAMSSLIISPELCQRKDGEKLAQADWFNSIFILLTPEQLLTIYKQLPKIHTTSSHEAQSHPTLN